MSDRDSRMAEDLVNEVEKRWFNAPETGYKAVFDDDGRLEHWSAKGVRDINTGTFKAIDREMVSQIYHDIGRTLRKYHDMGYAHKYLSIGNIGLLQDGSGYRVVFRDLDTTETLLLKDSFRHRAGFRFMDISRIAYDLVRERGRFGATTYKEYIEPFLSGYFSEMDKGSLELQEIQKEITLTGFSDVLESLHTGRSHYFAYNAGAIDNLELSRSNKHFGKVLSSLYDIEAARETSSRMLGATLSRMMKKKLVIAIDQDVTGEGAQTPLKVMRSVERLIKSPGFESFEGNIEIIISSRARLIKEVQEYFDDEMVEVFMFAGIENRDNVAMLEDSMRAVYIDKAEYEIGNYFPLAEIISMSLAKTFTDKDSGEFEPLLKELNITMEEAESIYIFRILPNACKIDPVKMNRLIHQFLESA